MDYRFLRLLLWVLPLWLAVTPAIGQDTPGDDSVRETNLSINLKDQSLQEALTLLHQLSGCNFLYDQSLADRVPRITLNMQNASLSEILDRIASITNLQYSRVDNTITFASKGGVAAPEPDCPAAALQAGKTCRERWLMKTENHWRELRYSLSAAGMPMP